MRLRTSLLDPAWLTPRFTLYLALVLLGTGQTVQAGPPDGLQQEGRLWLVPPLKGEAALEGVIAQSAAVATVRAEQALTGWERLAALRLA